MSTGDCVGPEAALVFVYIGMGGGGYVRLWKAFLTFANSSEIIETGEEKRIFCMCLNIHYERSKIWIDMWGAHLGSFLTIHCKLVLIEEPSAWFMVIWYCSPLHRAYVAIGIFCASGIAKWMLDLLMPWI